MKEWFEGEREVLLPRKTTVKGRATKFMIYKPDIMNLKAGTDMAVYTVVFPYRPRLD